MTKEEMAKAYADGFIEEYREIAYYAFLCGYGAKCSLEIPNNLEEAANNYLDGVYGKMPHSDFHIAIFIAGAKWQKEQMMKNALHGWLDEDNEPPYDLNVICEEKIPFGEFKHCDKIRIIIMKEDEK